MTFTLPPNMAHYYDSKKWSRWTMKLHNGLTIGNRCWKHPFQSGPCICNFWWIFILFKRQFMRSSILIWHLAQQGLRHTAQKRQVTAHCNYSSFLIRNMESRKIYFRQKNAAKIAPAISAALLTLFSIFSQIGLHNASDFRNILDASFFAVPF